MLLAGSPGNEEARLRALADYEILDSDVEPAFDAIARLVAVMFDVPIALVTIVDRDQVWLKAHHGLPGGHAPREDAFDRFVLAENAPLVVVDATQDPRFATNPYVAGDPGIRFYAGVPLHGHGGHVLGTLCAIDLKAREPTARQLEALGLLAAQVVALLELRRSAVLLSQERARLVEVEQRLQTVFDGLTEAVVLHDRTGRILHHNRMTETILGLTHDELTGTGSLDPRWCATHEDGSPFPGEDHPAMVSLRTGTVQKDVIMRLTTGRGESRWLNINARPLISATDPLPYGVVVTFRDVTEQRAIAEQMARQQRLVTTGTLAAGVGHEINNPLTYMLANIALAVEELQVIGGGSPSKRIIEIITLLGEARDGGERVKRIVRGLKALVRDEAEVGPTNLHGVVRDALNMTGHELRMRAQIEVELPAVHDLALVLADESRLTQVFVNLLVNAAQAFTTTDLARNHILVRSLPPTADQRITVEIVDNGPGIAPHTLPRIFDPFFTTKSPNEGTGLGLSISHGIVSAVGGELTCETTLGQGTRFRVTLPIAQRAPAEKPVAPKRGRVLVVDDEPIILTTMRRMLQTEFEVITSDDPRAALEAIENGARYDVIFSDISMSHLSGVELYKRVAAIDQALATRFVFISGDLTRSDIREFIESVPNERIEKPFNIQEIRALVRRLVASP